MVQGRWVVSQVAVAVIVYGTLIRRSSGEVTDIHMKPARSGMTLVEIPLIVSSLVIEEHTDRDRTRSSPILGTNRLPLEHGSPPQKSGLGLVLDQGE